MKHTTARTSAIASVGVLAAATLVVALQAPAPAAFPTTNMIVSEGVTEHIAAEEARIAAEEARKAAEEAERQAWANTMSGIGPSAYTGQFYDPGYEATRQCIVNKESTGNYAVVSSNGMYHGAYQFMLGTSDNAARAMGRADLVGVPASQWNRAEQDEAFYTTWNHGAGRGHWPTAAGC
jgi:hypothetical protein